MVVDTSAVVAILFDEDDGATFAGALETATVRLMSAVSFVQATLVIEGRKGPQARHLVDRFVEQAEIELVPVAIEHAHRACEAFRIYGKGRHPARLNLGDCFAYALSRIEDQPLLFKGGDFSQTDIVSAF